VRLIHFTLQEYLSTSSDIFSKPPSKMTEICLTYMNSRQVKAIRGDRFHETSHMPFLQYCSIYWGVHAKWVLSGDAKSLALQLLQECEGHISTELLLRETAHCDDERAGIHFPFTGLHYASLLGVTEVVAALLDTGCYDTDGGDFWGAHHLHWRHGGAMRKL